MKIETCAAQHFGHWACEPKWLRQAIAAVQAGTWKPEAAKPTDPNGKPYAMGGSNGDTAIISVSGQITKGRSSFGGASTVATRRALRAAAEDSGVKAILMVIDSPGGTVAGTGDLADDVATISKKKPVYAYIEDLGASAAYWIASQAVRVFANATAEIGSIGVYAVLEDTTGMQKADGIRLTVVSTGEFKGLGADGKVDEKLVGEVQREVNAINEQFIGAVARGRGMAAVDVAKVATGQVWLADKAKRLGLIDEVASIDAAMTAISRKVMQMTKDQFDTVLAEHPDWIAGEREQAKKLGATEARASEIARAKAIREACPGNDTVALDTFIAGKDPEDGKATLAIIAKATADADAKNAALVKEVEKLKAQVGTQGPVNTNAESQAKGGSESGVWADPKAQAESEWKANANGEQQKFISQETFAAYRVAELNGQIRRTSKKD